MWLFRGSGPAPFRDHEADCNGVLRREAELSSGLRIDAKLLVKVYRREYKEERPLNAANLKH